MNKHMDSGHRKLRAVGVALAVVVATLVPGTSWAAGEATAEATATLSSTPFANTTYGLGAVSGKAELEQKDGRLSIRAEVQGLKPGTSHVGHLHFGSCTSLIPGEVVAHLKPLTVGQDGQGRSVTVIADATRANLAAVQDCDLWVAFHEGATNTTPPSPAAAVGPVLLQQD